MAATDVAPCRKSRGTCGTLGRSLEYLPTQVPNGETESPLFLWPCFSGVMIYRCRWVIVFMPYAYLHAPRGTTGGSCLSVGLVPRLCGCSRKGLRTC
jgi:hypothetical protein